MKVETYKCDVCGKQKGDVNHWYVIRWARTKDNRFLSLVTWSDGALSSRFTIGGENVECKHEFHLCGAECVQKKVNEFLGGNHGNTGRTSRS